MKQLTVGILAHVDAGKTTLSEAMLYMSGSIRKIGRVDHKDAFLDTFALERERGITIFSKQARLELPTSMITLLDTPGHVDFAAEAERTLRVLDYAILVISGADGVQGHTETLMGLLKSYQVPTALFINKMDQSGTDPEERLRELKNKLGDGCIDFSNVFDHGNVSDDYYDELAMCDEAAMEEFLETGRVSDDTIRRLIRERKVFPCVFGSALKLQGVEELLSVMDTFFIEDDPDAGKKPFGAKVFKISRDPSGARLTHIKVTSGMLKVKEVLTEEEKVEQIRLYHGAKYETAQEACAGMAVVVTGLTKTKVGQGLGIEADDPAPQLKPVLQYRLALPKGCDVHQAYVKCKQLEEEEPLLHILWEESLGEIYAQVMGEVQIEILKEILKERFALEVEFDAGNVVYKETITTAAEGVGHYEPLRHYAEAHLLLEPGEKNSGITIATAVGEDDLDLNWQRLILTHVLEKEHRGMLIGAALTDVRITLVAGRAHLKHTEGGDFRQATYRAIRHGLRKCAGRILEPVYSYRLSVPAEVIGHAMADVQRMQGTFSEPEADGDYMILTGTAPVIAMRDYQRELASYARGRGRLTLNFGGYEPCHNEEEVIEEYGYDPDLDVENPSGSVFCGHGAGFYVPWDEVENYMHLPLVTESARGAKEEQADPLPKRREEEKPFGVLDKELEAIFTRTYGPIKSRVGVTEVNFCKEPSANPSDPKYEKQRRVDVNGRKNRSEEYLLVDGYNIIFSWEELNQLAKDNLAGARGVLMDVLSDYQGYKRNTVILVFDAYKVEGGTERIFKYHNIHVVFTKESETADMYIEKTVHRLGKIENITVASSDGLEQIIILAAGGRRMSARELKEEIDAAKREMRELHLENVVRKKSGGSCLGDLLPEEAKEIRD